MTQVGALILDVAEHSGAILIRAGRAARDIASLRVDARETLRQLDRFLRDAIPLVFASCIVVGGIVAMQGLGYLRRYDAREVFGWAAALSAYRDVGPLLLGCALAARVGARNTAEVALMAARERLDALRALGVDPERAILAPRLIASVLIALLLYTPATTLVLLVAFLLAAAIGDQPVATSVWSFVTYVEPKSIANGLVRMTMFGLILGLSSCHAGAAVERSSDRSAGAIGRAVYLGSVLSLAGVLITNAVLSLMGGTS